MLNYSWTFYFYFWIELKETERVSEWERKGEKPNTHTVDKYLQNIYKFVKTGGIGAVTQKVQQSLIKFKEQTVSISVVLIYFWRKHCIHYWYWFVKCKRNHISLALCRFFRFNSSVTRYRSQISTMLLIEFNLKILYSNEYYFRLNDCHDWKLTSKKNLRIV